MRTTLHIDDDILRAARSLARAEDKTVGEVVSDLARRGLAPKPRTRRAGIFPTFDVPANAPPITAEMVRRASED